MSLNKKIFINPSASVSGARAHFNTVIYDGSLSEQSITGVGFQPDFVWIKNRDYANSNIIVDSVRGGDSTRLFNLSSDNKDIETTDNRVKTLDSDGFTVFANQSPTNAPSNGYVAWCLKAGGTAVSNTSGLINSSVSVNSDLGFSIVSYTGTGNSNNTVGHGLGVEPELVIIKNRDLTNTIWLVGSKQHLGEGDYLRLDSDLGEADFDYIPTMNATTFSIYNAASNHVNNSGDKYIAYCFASKTGLTKIGTYTGSGNSGNKITTNFEPTFLLTKRYSSSSSDWYIIDNKRSTDSDKNDYLSPNLNAIETASTSGVTFNSDGFTFNGASFNGTNDSHIYLAIA